MAEERRDLEQMKARLEKVVPELMDEGAIPGLSMALVRDGEKVWNLFRGVCDRKSGKKVEADTIFEAASLSKPVFAYAVLKMVERGELELDRPLAEYWTYEDIAHDERHRQITAHMVLSHTPGLPNWRGERLEFIADPGEKFRYSGEGFIYLQKVIEFLSGTKLDEWAREHVFEPLGMERSRYVWTRECGIATAVGHSMDNRPAEKGERPQANAASSLHSTAPDYARFLSAILEGRGLEEETLRVMWTPQIDVDEGVFWGLGWGLQESDGRRAFWQWGDNGNFKAYAIGYPETKEGLVMFANSFYGQSIVGELLEDTFGGEHPAVKWNGYERYDAPQRRVRDRLARGLSSVFSEVADRTAEVGVKWVDRTTYGELVKTLGYYPTCTLWFDMEPGHGKAFFNMSTPMFLTLLGAEKIELRPLEAAEIEKLRFAVRRVVDELIGAWETQEVRIEAGEMESGGPTLSLTLGEDVEYGGFMPPDGEVQIVGLEVDVEELDRARLNPGGPKDTSPAIVLCYPAKTLESIFP